MLELELQSRVGIGLEKLSACVGHFGYMKIALALLLLLLSACATTTIRVVDDRGKPIEGALVVSEQLPFMFLSHKLAVFVTDADGRAEVLSDEGHILKAGFYPVIGASEFDWDRVWSRTNSFKQVTTIYPVRRGSPKAIATSRYVLPPSEGPIEYRLPLNICTDKVVTFNIKTNELRVQSAEADLRGSSRFHFVGPAPGPAVSKLDGIDNLAFYCSFEKKLYKVGVSVAEKVWRRGVPSHRFIIFAAQIDTLDAYLEPGQCEISKRHSFFAEYPSTSPKLYTSENVKNELEGIRKSLLCTNPSIDGLFQFVEKLFPNL